MEKQFAVLAGVLIYLVFQILLGVWISRRVTTEADYLVAGRNLGPIICSFSIFATWFAAETCVSAAGQVYSHGLAGASVEPFAYGLAVVLFGLLFAAPLRKRGFMTAADLYRQRFGIGVERLVILLMVPTSVMWAAAQVRAFGQILGALTDFNVDLAITLAAAAIIVYSVFGGLLADTITDFVQGVLLILGLAALTATIFTRGDAAVLAEIPAERFSIFPQEQGLLEIMEKWAIPVLSSLTALELISRVLAARTPKIARWSAFSGGWLYLLIGLMPVLMGLVGHRLMPGLAEPEQVIILQAGNYLPTLLFILFAGALISAILSTVDSALLASASLIAHNLILPLKSDLAEKTKVRFNRVAVASLGLVAYFFAISAESVLGLVEEAVSFGTAGTLIIYLFAFRSGFGGKWAAISALLLGVGVFQLGNHVEGILSYPYLTAVVTALVGYLVVGWFEREHAPSTVTELGQ